jgi:hypothetical protein
MNMATKHEILQAHLGDWLKAKGNRAERGRLTCLLVEATKLHSKSGPQPLNTVIMWVL